MPELTADSWRKALELLAIDHLQLEDRGDGFLVVTRARTYGPHVSAYLSIGKRSTKAEVTLWRHRVVDDSRSALLRVARRVMTPQDLRHIASWLAAAFDLDGLDPDVWRTCLQTQALSVMHDINMNRP